MNRYEAMKVLGEPHKSEIHRNTQMTMPYRNGSILFCHKTKTVNINMDESAKLTATQVKAIIYWLESEI